jgi:uncharacterized protein
VSVVATLWEFVEQECPEAWRDVLRGCRHWGRVAATGAELVERTPGADAAVVFAFALLHHAPGEVFRDPPSPEFPRGRPTMPGRVAAGYAQELHVRGDLPLSDGQMAPLLLAIAEHDDGKTSSDPTVGCCWDADRLQVWGTGSIPQPRLLSTVAGVELREWARENLHEVVPWEVLAARAGFGAG